MFQRWVVESVCCALCAVCVHIIWRVFAFQLLFVLCALRPSVCCFSFSFVLHFLFCFVSSDRLLRCFVRTRISLAGGDFEWYNFAGKLILIIVMHSRWVCGHCAVLLWPTTAANLNETKSTFSVIVTYVVRDIVACDYRLTRRAVDALIIYFSYFNVCRWK